MSTAALQIKTNALAGSRLSVELQIPAERCKTSYEEALSRLSRSIKIPGFRQGKVPKAVILQQIGIRRIKATALEALLDTAWREAINQESITALSEPELKNTFEDLLESFDPSQQLTLILETDVPPSPKLKTTQGLKVEREKVSYDPNKVNELIEESRKQLATLVPVDDRPASKGDVAVVSFKGTYEDGSEIEGGAADSMEIELEEGKMIPGFVEGIFGMKISDEKILKCQFPDDYPQEDAKGRKASFSLTLKDLKVRELPELNDDFAKQASEKSNMAELREDLENRLKEDAKRRERNNLHVALVQALVEQLEVEIPKSLIDEEIRNLVEQTAHKFAQQGMDVKSMFTPELVKKLMESSKDEAKENLERKFALKALAQEESINVTEKEIETKFNEVKAELSKEKNIDFKRLRNAVEEDLLEEKLIQWLEENCEITDKAPPKKENKNESNKSKTSKK